MTHFPLRSLLNFYANFIFPRLSTHTQALLHLVCLRTKTKRWTGSSSGFLGHFKEGIALNHLPARKLHKLLWKSCCHRLQAASFSFDSFRLLRELRLTSQVNFVQLASRRVLLSHTSPSCFRPICYSANSSTRNFLKTSWRWQWKGTRLQFSCFIKQRQAWYENRKKKGQN